MDNEKNKSRITNAVELITLGKTLIDKIRPFAEEMATKQGVDNSNDSDTGGKFSGIVVNGENTEIVVTNNNTIIVNISGDCSNLNIHGVESVVVTSSSINTLNAINVKEVVNNSKQVNNLNI